MPAYYVGDTPQGPRLFREFAPRRRRGRRWARALAVLQQDPADPDYRTLWPAGVVPGATLEVRRDGVIEVALADASLHDRPPG